MHSISITIQYRGVPKLQYYNVAKLIKYVYYWYDLPLAHMPMKVPQCLITTSTNGLAVSMCSLLSIYHRKSWAVIADTSHFKMLNRSISHICKPNDGLIAHIQCLYTHINNNNKSNNNSSNNNQLTRHLTTTTNYGLQSSHIVITRGLVVTAAATGGCRTAASEVCRETFIIYAFIRLHCTTTHPAGCTHKSHTV